MNYAEMLLPEFDREMANTRKVLERVPENRLDWQAHPRSHTIGWNANHLAEILGWVETWLAGLSWDFAPVGGEPYHVVHHRAVLCVYLRLNDIPVPGMYGPSGEA